MAIKPMTPNESKGRKRGITPTVSTGLPPVPKAVQVGKPVGDTGLRKPVNPAKKAARVAAIQAAGGMTLNPTPPGRPSPKGRPLTKTRVR